MSGQSDVKIAIQSVKLGAMDYITKDSNALPKLLIVLKDIEDEIKDRQNKSRANKIIPKIKRFLTDGD